MRLRLDRQQIVDYSNHPYSAFQEDHRYRILVTAGLIAARQDVKTIFDPAVGDGAVLKTAHALRRFNMAYVGDVSPHNIDGVSFPFPAAGMIGDVVVTLNNLPEQVDMVVMTELLEHLDDPDLALVEARRHSRLLIASSPFVHEGDLDENPEHLWQFDKEGYRRMLEDAGWETIIFNHLAFKNFPYEFQIWVAQ